MLAETFEGDKGTPEGDKLTQGEDKGQIRVTIPIPQKYRDISCSGQPQKTEKELGSHFSVGGFA
jgi:hypothetical protein